MDDIKITILVDNKVPPGLEPEHGFSLWIETEGRKILFDTGQGKAFFPNTSALGIDWTQADSLIISHGHYDHTGAVSQFIESNPEAEVYCHPGVTQSRYSIRDGKPHYIGMSLEAIQALNSISENRVRWVNSPTLLSKRLGITGPIPRETTYEDVGGAFYLDPEGKQPDPIIDDLTLWIESDDGLIICLGCCHSGLINTLRYIMKITRETRIRAVIGGMHLVNANKHRIEQTINELKVMKPEQIIPCHCTGAPAFKAICDAFGDRARVGEAGQCYRFGI